MVKGPDNGDEPREIDDLLSEELRRRGMSEAEIKAVTRKRKRKQALEMSAVRTRWEKPYRTRTGGSAGELCTVEFASERLKLHPKTVLRFIHEGRLKANRIGKSYRILRADLEAFAGLPATAATAPEEASVTSIVDLPDVSPELARRWAVTVPAALRPRHSGPVAVRAEVIYEPERRNLKIIVVGSPGDTINILSLIRVWVEQLAE